MVSVKLATGEKAKEGEGEKERELAKAALSVAELGQYLSISDSRNCTSY